MLNHLIWKGVEEAEELLQKFVPLLRYGQGDLVDSNSPLQKRALENTNILSQRVFEVASHRLSNHQILSYIQKWIQQDKTSFLVRATSNIDSSLTDILEALRRYYQMGPEGMELAPSARIGVRAALIRRLFTDQLEFIIIAKNFVRISDFYDLLQHTIFPAGSHGKLGGKSAGMFLAFRILTQMEEHEKLLRNIKVPKTWYLSSDSMIHFMHFNNLEELLEQKYKPIDEVRKEYPHVVQLFKNSHFPPEMVQGLSMALDDFGTKPLIVRSSSILEDRLGSAFSGKYKSLFLANQGGKHKRLEALLDAIAEVYASTLGPDPIQYRAERGLIDFHEEMGIMIQEVVGTQVGDYFLPSFAGVAFSNNEFRWSPRINREDGLIRLVAGLGTRAVDRLSDDYPVLIAPGKPGLRANVSTEDIIRYSPQMVDVLNLKSNQFETVGIKKVFKACGNDIPLIEKIVSIYHERHLRKPFGLDLDLTEQDFVVTFEGLINDTGFIKEIHSVLKILQNALATPVDIEFASNGKDFYLLQCRPQSYSKFDSPSPIPKNIPKNRLLFSANKYVSNGIVPDISYVVYVDPEKYNAISKLEHLRAIGEAVGNLNRILPKREFILMGPGRWGSRGDIKLGVSVTYSDINNSAVLVEIARQKGNYVPDLSFGTHFFQDLVEASIRYLPLYPDDQDVDFNEKFFLKSENKLAGLLPEYAYLADVVRVIHLPSVANDMVLRVLMNAEKNKAVGILSPRAGDVLSQNELNEHMDMAEGDHWRWRLDMVERIANQLKDRKYGVKSLYLHGSTQNRTAQAGSDIDLLVEFDGSGSQKTEFERWIEGWSLCLDEINYMKTGIKAGGLIDLRFVTSEELTDPLVMSQRYNVNLESVSKLF